MKEHIGMITFEISLAGLIICMFLYNLGINVPNIIGHILIISLIVGLIKAFFTEFHS